VFEPVTSESVLRLQFLQFPLFARFPRKTVSLVSVEAVHTRTRRRPASAIRAWQPSSLPPLAQRENPRVQNSAATRWGRKSDNRVRAWCFCGVCPCDPGESLPSASKVHWRNWWALLARVPSVTICFVVRCRFLWLHQRRIDGRASTSSDRHCPLPRPHLLFLD